MKHPGQSAPFAPEHEAGAEFRLANCIGLVVVCDCLVQPEHCFLKFCLAKGFIPAGIYGFLNESGQFAEFILKHLHLFLLFLGGLNILE